MIPPSDWSDGEDECPDCGESENFHLPHCARAIGGWLVEEPPYTDENDQPEDRS